MIDQTNSIEKTTHIIRDRHLAFESCGKVILSRTPRRLEVSDLCLESEEQRPGEGC